MTHDSHYCVQQNNILFYTADELTASANTITDSLIEICSLLKRVFATAIGRSLFSYKNNVYKVVAFDAHYNIYTLYFITRLKMSIGI